MAMERIQLTFARNVGILHEGQLPRQCLQVILRIVQDSNV